MRLVYSEALMDHFLRPRHVGRLDADSAGVGSGTAGTAETGGVLRIQLQVDAGGQVTDSCFKAYGPPALIAAGSWLAEAIRGGTLAQAEALGHPAVVSALALPPAQVYCALLAEDAMRAAIQEYKDKQRAYA